MPTVISNFKKLTLFLLVGISSSLMRAQNEFFHDIGVSKKIEHREEWNTVFNLNWKHIYNEIGWKRWGLEAKTIYQMNQWGLFGGIANYYTFDPEIDNYFELRPFVGISLKTNITKRITFNQRFQSEWRNLFYGNHNLNSHNVRLRYRIGSDFKVTKENTTSLPWIIRFESEWYLLNNLDQRERYINSTEYSMMFLKTLKKEKELRFGYRLEKLNKIFYSERENGHTLFVEFEF
jgi:hypothetical protein